MISALVGILFAIIVVGVILWAILEVLKLIPLPPPLGSIVNIVVVLIVVLIALWIVAQLLGVAGIHVGFPRISQWPFRSITS